MGPETGFHVGSKLQGCEGAERCFVTPLRGAVDREEGEVEIIPAALKAREHAERHDFICFRLVDSIRVHNEAAANSVLRMFRRRKSSPDLASGFLKRFGERVDRSLSSPDVNASVSDKDRISLGGEG